MEMADHIEALRQEGRLLARAAAGTPWDAPVPTCPGWLLRDLVHHTGRVHRWAAAHVAEARTEPLDEAGSEAAWGPKPGDGALLDWFREGHEQLVATLEKAPADLVCWSFLPAPSPPAFWARRQAHETAVHRMDAESAAGRAPVPVAGAFAEDGVDELLCGFLVRPVSRLRSERPRTLLVRITDAADGRGELTVSISGGPVVVRREAGPADCTVSGRAADLYAALWNRRPADPEHGIEVAGDRSLLDLWSATAQVR
ncbi:maleylpyruvate isomerase family mycothiol-dependent enzyme [Peterkaempfera griseoplana]|uniref:maleylpyruvate isomerase family mycothiol-dependent enzyme n=1 Tax=Peterkaempfera griseoplana TaxID=66896 RepID=UPI0006E29453|nr:maleylpyruvate isomerase family mycothiol-dependent enzyme [Peterkaempfera griseoplana]